MVLWLLLVRPGFGQGSDFAWSLQHLREQMGPQWLDRALQIGRTIFLTLLIIDVLFFGYSVAMGNIQRPTLQVIVKRIIIYGVLYAILIWFKKLGLIAAGFRRIANQVTGLNETVSPYNLISKGFEFFVMVLKGSFKQITLWSLFTNNVYASFRMLLEAFLGFVVMVGFFTVALQLAFLEIEIMMAISIGPVFLGFSPLKATRKMGTAYVSYVLSLGIRLFVFFIILGFAYGTMDNILQKLQSPESITFQFTYSLAFFSMLTVFLLAKLPGRIEQKITQHFEFNVEGLIPTTLAD